MRSPAVVIVVASLLSTLLPSKASGAAAVAAKGHKKDATEKAEVSSPFSEEETYTKWAEVYLGKYDRSSVLQDNASSSVAMHWALENEDTPEARIRLAIAVEASGWIGFGIGENGGMKGSDMFIFQPSSGTSKDHTDVDQSQLTDAYSMALERPVTDIQQDWKLIRSIVDDGFIIVEVERLLDTKDPMDWPITKDSHPMMPGTKVIAAWGDTEGMQYHGAKNRLKGEVRLFGPPPVSHEHLFKEEMDREAEGSVVMKMENVRIPFKKTTLYEHKCFTAVELAQNQNLPNDKPLHLIGIEWIIDIREVHHIILFKSDSVELCNFKGPLTTINVWSRGQGSDFILFPHDVGMILTGETSQPRPSFLLEVHYENPEKIKGGRDNSGVRLFYTSKLRDMTAGVLDLADPRLKLTGQPVGEGRISHRFSCPDACTKNHFPANGVTVFSEMLHMHKTGLSMHNIQKRAGKEVRRGSVQYYDFEQGGHYVKQEPYRILPGDTFETVCNYDGKRDLLFGYSSTMEMCITWIIYYPVADVSLTCAIESDVDSCVAQHTATQLTSPSGLERTFGFEQSVVGLGTTISPQNGSPLRLPFRESGKSLKDAFLVLGVGVCGLFLLLIIMLCRGKSAKKYTRVNTEKESYEEDSESCMGIHQTVVRRRTVQHTT